MISIFDIFKIGIGPSSSHTIGPMKAAKAFVDDLQRRHLLASVTHIQVKIHGSLALTGKGHHTDTALILGLAGFLPETVDIEGIPQFLAAIEDKQTLDIIAHHHTLNFQMAMLDFIPKALPLHENGIKFLAYEGDNLQSEQVYYSVGGGFIVTEEAFSKTLDETQVSANEFKTAEELLALCEQQAVSISDLMLVNERQFHSLDDIDRKLAAIWQVMQAAITRGCQASGVLPGPLSIKRRAPDLYQALVHSGQEADPLYWMDWVNLYALAISEENAAGGRVVTSPTNGAAGIVPAVMAYYNHFIAPLDAVACRRFILTAAAVGMLFKMNASISGAEVGCQGEVGVSSAMAAAGLAELMGATPLKVTEAAEIAMEHHLGLTCDPVGGQVQIPCIERNAMSAMKAVNACRMAINRTTAATVSLDAVIATMYETGKDMHMKYRETSQGGLALKVPPACK